MCDRGAMFHGAMFRGAMFHGAGCHGTKVADSDHMILASDYTMKMTLT